MTERKTEFHYDAYKRCTYVVVGKLMIEISEEYLAELTEIHMVKIATSTQQVEDDRNKLKQEFEQTVRELTEQFAERINQEEKKRNDAERRAEDAERKANLSDKIPGEWGDFSGRDVSDSAYFSPTVPSGPYTFRTVPYDPTGTALPTSGPGTGVHWFTEDSNPV